MDMLAKTTLEVHPMSRHWQLCGRHALHSMGFCLLREMEGSTARMGSTTSCSPGMWNHDIKLFGEQDRFDSSRAQEAARVAPDRIRHVQLQLSRESRTLHR